ncbi:DnaD domain-containing protein [Oscillibacter sp.]|uniref:DnaD domain-containing protein n=1 Tax=Oscillibacter sp. TaxID=1945593 RepID=UPI002D7F5E47|nr:DnaD domain protein [Oscillibacter sp.]
MPSVLVHAPDDPVTLSAQAVKRLLDRGSGDAALLYLALLRRHGDAPPRSLAGELRWDKGRIEAAEAVLRDLGLIAPQGPPPAPADEPPVYQQDEVAGKLEESEDFRRLTAEVERRLGKRLTTADISVLLGLYDYLGLPSDVIYLLVCHCAERTAARLGPGRKPTLRQIEREGYAWARRGVDTQAAAAAYLRDYNRRQGALPGFMRALRLGDRPPVESEEKYLLQWLEWGFSPEAAALAYDKTVLKCGAFKWSYCNGILRRWHEAGLHAVEEIEAGDKRPQAPAAPAARTASGGAGGNAWMRKYIRQREKEG